MKINANSACYFNAYSRYRVGWSPAEQYISAFYYNWLFDSSNDYLCSTSPDTTPNDLKRNQYESNACFINCGHCGMQVWIVNSSSKDKTIHIHWNKYNVYTYVESD